jgi:DHA1 family inner membrane transport protein
MYWTLPREEPTHSSMNSQAHELTALRRAMSAWKRQGTPPVAHIVADLTGSDAGRRESGIAFVLFALALGTFGIGTTEFVAMGLLPEIADGIGASITTAGHVVSAYALGVVVGAPVLAVLTARLPRRPLLMALMATFAAGNFLSAIAPNYHTLIAARFFAGLPHGAFFGIGALVAASLAGQERRAWAVARVFLGLTVATVIGVPAATAVGQHLGWRSVFVAVAVIGVLSLVAIARWMPPVPAAKNAAMRTELGALRRPQVWLTLGVGAIGYGGMFAVYSYMSPTLTNLAGMRASIIPLVLAVWGMGMVAGTFIGGWLAHRSPMRALFIILVATASFLALFVVTSAHPLAATVSVFMLGTCAAIVPPLQVRLMDVAADAQSLAAALVHAAFNLANAIGPWLGGLAIAAGFGWTGPSGVGVALAIGGLAILGWSALLQRRTTAKAGDAAARTHIRELDNPSQSQAAA